MVQVSQSLSVKLMRADNTHNIQNSTKSSLDFSLMPGFQAKNEDQKYRMNKAVPSCSTQNLDECKAVKITLNPEARLSDRDMERETEFGDGQIPESPPPVKGWVIGPLFQSFKSKMASFTEIVMSPVKLFKPANVPPSTTVPDADQVENSKHCDAVHFEGQLEKMDVNNGSKTGTDTGLPHSQELGDNTEDNSNNSLNSNQDEPGALGKHVTTARGGQGKRTSIQEHSVVKQLSFNLDFKSHSLSETDTCAIKVTQSSNSILASNDQKDMMLFKMTEKTNSGSVPCVGSPLLQSSGKQSPESTKFSSCYSPASHLSDNTRASRGSKLNLNFHQETQMGSTGSQQRPPHVSRNKSTAKRSSSEIVSSEMACSSAASSGLCGASRSPALEEADFSGKQFALKYDSQSEINDSTDNDTPGPLLSSVYYTPPDSLCAAVDCGERDSGLHEDTSMLVCGSQSQMSIRKSSRKSLTNCTLRDSVQGMADSSQSDLKKLEQSKQKQDPVINTTGKRTLKASALIEVEGNCEKKKRKRVMKGKKCEDQAEGDGGLNAGFRSSTLASSEHKESDPKPRMSRKRGSAKSQDLQTLTANSSNTNTMEVEPIQELTKAIGPVTKSSRDKGTGRRGNLKLSKAPPEIATSSSIELKDPTVISTTTGSLKESSSKGKRTKISVEQDCFSSTKRLKKQNSTRLSRSEYVSVACDMELETTMITSVVTTTTNEPTPAGSVQRLNSEVLSKTPRIPQKVGLRKRKVFTMDDVEPSQNPRKCQKSVDSYPSPEGDEGSMPLHSGTNPKLTVRLNRRKVKRIMDDKGKGREDEVEDVLSKHSQIMMDVKEQVKDEECTDLFGVKDATETHRHKRQYRKKPRKVDCQKRKCQALAMNKAKEEEEEEEKREDKDKEMCRVPGEQLGKIGGGIGGVCSSDGTLTGRLLRSYSCPDNLSLLHGDSPWNMPLLPPHRGRTVTSRRHQSPHGAPGPHPLRSSRRARRHTVCSVEVAREIAPLCLRKEVYPTRRCSPYGKAHHLFPSVPLSPSTCLSAQASCFLSSPLAFLSKKTDKRVFETSGNGCSLLASSLSPTVFTSSSSPSCSSPWHQFPGSQPSILPRSDISSTSVSSLRNALSQIPLESDSETRLQGVDEDWENTSCSSQEFESMGIREEKSLSDSEIKTGSSRNEERGKVSSIRICKALPKPQNNLTPMGLPRLVRLKKKEFSLEEIYTNKNFTKPPEGRLETIFELPLNRRNGSQSLIGQKRLKRFVEFPEVGVSRKPRKPLVGAGKVGLTSAGGRPRRGGYPDSKDDRPVSLQDLDSLLCSKLDQLEYWLAFDQETS